MTALFLTKRYQLLAERWLRIHREATVTLLAPKPLLQLAHELKTQYPSVIDISILPENMEEMAGMGSSAKNWMQLSRPEKIVLPLSLDTTRYNFVADANVPEIRPFYSRFRALWFEGFRQFEIFNLNGTQKLSLPHLLDEFVDVHKGDRCFVVGNGPSINNIDMTRLRHEITLGANRCYLGYEKWGFPFTYWGIVDRLQIEEYGWEYEDNIPGETVKFFPFEYLPLLRFDNACPVNHLYDVPDFPQFSHSPDVIYLGNTVTYMLIQIAAIMGCDPIILVGVDHSYSLKDRLIGRLPEESWQAGKLSLAVLNWLKRPLRGTTPYEIAWCWKQARMRRRSKEISDEAGGQDFWQASDAAEATHFDNRYTAGAKRFVPPRPDRAEAAFECAARWAEAQGRQILNATPGTALKAFPLVSYESLF